MQQDEDEQDRRRVAAFLAGRGEAAFRELYRHHAPRLHSLLHRLCDTRVEDADDLFQECWVRIVRALEGFQGRSSFSTWTTGIALNCLRETRRRSWLAPPSEGVEPQACAARPTAPGERIDVEAALRALPEGYRAVLVLHDVHGHSHEEIAELLGIVAGTSKSQLSRARAALRRMLDPETHHA